MAKKNNNGDDKNKSVTIRTWDINRSTTPGTSGTKQTPSTSKSGNRNRSGVKIKRTSTSSKPQHKVTATEQIRKIPIPEKKGLPDYKMKKPERGIPSKIDRIPPVHENQIGIGMNISHGKGKQTAGLQGAAKGNSSLGQYLTKDARYATDKMEAELGQGTKVNKATRNTNRDLKKIAKNEGRVKSKVGLMNKEEAKEYDKRNRNKKAQIKRMGKTGVKYKP